MITDGFTYVSVLLFVVAVLVTLEKISTGRMKKFFRYVPAFVLCYIVNMLLCTFKLWDLGETQPAYSVLKNNLTYAMIFAMLLQCNIRKVIRLGPRMLVAFFSATFTIIVGFICAFIVMKGVIGADAWKGLGALCGSWIGGSANLVAVQTALDISEADIGYALVVDSIEYSLWVMFLLWAVSLAPRFNRWTGADTGILDEVSRTLEKETAQKTDSPTFQSLMLLIGCSLVASAVAAGLGTFVYNTTGLIDRTTWTVLIVTAAALIAAVTPLGRVSGSETVSNLLLYSVISLLASRATLLEMGDAPAWMLTGFIVLAVHTVLFLIICKLIRLDLFTASVASLANIGGTACASVLSGAYSGSLIPIGVLMALMGYVVGTPLAVVCANIIQIFA